MSTAASANSPPPPAPDMSLTLYDAYLDLLHPAASPTVNEPRLIIAPPPGKAMESARAVGKELSTEKGLAMVARFCFPEFDDEAHARELAHKSDSSDIPNSGASLNKYDVYLQEYFFSNYKNYGNKHRPHTAPYSSTFGPSYHSFAMQLSSGDRVYGHVRRYFPHHPVAKGRIDVGRRGMRAMVILTRANGGEKFYRALFKCLEALQSQKNVMAPDLRNSKKPEQKILHYVHTEHTRLLKLYLEQKTKDTVEGHHNGKKLPVISLKKIEFNNPHFQIVDEYNLQLPLTLLTPIDSTQISSAPILPLLRCLGVAHILRLFSALLCERRVILVSHSPSRLSACANATVSMLAQGAVHWPHLYIPVLPPGMKPYLAAPVPYLVGLIANHAKSLELVQGGIGQAAVVDLDMNDIQVHGVTNHELFIPDLLRVHADFEPAEWFTSIIEVLKEELVVALRADRKLVGETVVRTIGGSSAKDGFFRKAMKSIKGFDKPKTSALDNSVHEDNRVVAQEELYAFGEGVDNEAAEEGIKVAFTNFFVHLLGDMKCYLRPPTAANKLPEFDNDMFLDARERLGDRNGTAMYAMLKVFKDTQIFEQFVKARIKEVLSQMPVTSAAPLFHRVTNHLRFNRMSFTGPDVNMLTKELSMNTSNRQLLMQASDVRIRAMALTSNSRNENDAPFELASLSRECKEGVFILTEVMCVVWERLRDSRGMQWKHGLYGLQIVKELILQGPMTAVVEATDGLSRIHKLCSYEYSMRPAAAQQIRGLARNICSLLMNRVKLFSQRRVCASRRKDAVTPPPPLTRNPKLRARMKFRDAHALVFPGELTSVNLLDTNLGAPVTKNTYTNDLLAFDFSPVPADSPAEIISTQTKTNPIPPVECDVQPLVETVSGLTIPNNIPPGRISQQLPSTQSYRQPMPNPNANPNFSSQYPSASTYPATSQQQQYRSPSQSTSPLPQPAPQYNSYQQGQVSQQQYNSQQQQLQPDTHATTPYFHPPGVTSQPQQPSQVNTQNQHRVSQFDPF